MDNKQSGVCVRKGGWFVPVLMLSPELPVVFGSVSETAGIVVGEWADWLNGVGLKRPKVVMLLL